MSVPSNRLSGKERFYVAVNNQPVTVSLQELTDFILKKLSGG